MADFVIENMNEMGVHAYRVQKKVHYKYSFSRLARRNFVYEYAH